MRLWALLAALLLGTVVLAGCSDDDGGEGDPTPTTSSSATTTSAATTTTTASSTTSTTQQNVPPPDEPANSAPVGSIAAVPAVNLPRTVNFTLDGGDPEDDNLVWDLFFGDGQSANGATFPTNVSHQYPANGTYNVTFSITDGRLQTTYNVTVNSTATIAAPAPGGGAGGAIVVSGDVVVNCASACEGCDPAGAAGCVGGPGASGCAAFNAYGAPAPVPAFDCIVSVLPAEAAGRAFTATSTAGDPDLEFFNACDPVDGASLGASLNVGPEAGTVPAGAGCVVIWEFNPVAPPPSTITFTVA